MGPAGELGSCGAGRRRRYGFDSRAGVKFGFGRTRRKSLRQEKEQRAEFGGIRHEEEGAEFTGKR